MTVDEPTPGSTSEVAPEPTRARSRRVRRGPILFVVLVAVIAAVVAQQNAPSDSGRSGAAAAVVLRDADGIPAADAASSAWYCAAGTSQPDGTADETVVVASLAPTDVEATITVMPGGDAASETRTLRLAPGEQVSVAVADILETPEPGVVVEIVGGPAAVSHVLEHDNDIAVERCTRTAAPDWYFASGTTVDGSQHGLVLFNPFGDDAIVDITFVTDTGAQEPAALQALVVPRRSRVTIPVQDSVLRQTRAATQVHARAGRVVAEQTQVFDDIAVDGVDRDGIALSLGATAPAAVWRVAAGSTENGGNGLLALANFTDTDARVDVKVVRADGERVPVETVRVRSQGVVVVDVTTRVPLDTEYAVVATSRAIDGRRVPIVAEFLATWSPASSTTGLAGTIATTATASRWVMPQPDVDGEGFLTVFNPGPDPVTAALLPADLVDRATGATSQPELAIPPGGVKTVRLALLGSRPVTAVLTANHPVVVGYTVLGGAGAAVSASIPDPTHRG